jgi:FtsZ-interacting cell division protein ZipA
MLKIYVQIIGWLSAVRRIFWIRRKELVDYFKVFPRIRTQKHQDENSLRTVGQPDEISPSRIRRKIPESMER